MMLGILGDERNFADIDGFTAWLDQLPTGWTSVWLGSHQSWDPLTLLAVGGIRRPDLYFGSAVTLTYPQHPVALAMQALTVRTRWPSARRRP